MEPVADLLAAAQAETGLEDYGVDTFREGLEILVRSLRDEARLNAVGQYVLRTRIVAALCNRLRIEDTYRRHPEIDDVEVAPPLLGLGLPRTGSTALSNLLAEDPGARSLRMWESSEPCPPPSTVVGPDPRIAAAEAMVQAQDAIAPRLRALVPSSATGPMECLDLMGLDFKTHLHQAFARIPSYSSWFLDADLTTAYAYEKRVLKLLAWGEPTRPWRLKSPTHLLFLDAWDEVFPGTRFVMTHRDPTEVMVSVTDLYCEFRRMCSDDVDAAEVGELNVEHWTVAMQRALAFRDKDENDHRFYDMDFRAMQRDPLGEVQRLYAWLGEPVTPEFEAGMQRWWHDNAETREQNVYPDAAELGLDLDAVRPQFADYVARAKQWTRSEGASQ